MSDIIDQANDIVAQKQLKDKQRYTACGCHSCRLQSDALEPDDHKVIDCKNEPDAIKSKTVWLCYGCLRVVSSPNNTCLWCNEGRV